MLIRFTLITCCCRHAITPTVTDVTPHDYATASRCRFEFYISHADEMPPPLMAIDYLEGQILPRQHTIAAAFFTWPCVIFTAVTMPLPHYAITRFRDYRFATITHTLFVFFTAD